MRLAAGALPSPREAARLAGQAGRNFDDDVEAKGLAHLLRVGIEINADVDEAAFRAALSQPTPSGGNSLAI
jgi:hypothetical protein